MLFSGDKLLGGPQGGVIIGKKELIDRMKAHPLARAFRVDKMTLSAMEATFFEYLDRSTCRRNVPILRMLTMGREELLERAGRLKALLEEQTESFVYAVEACGSGGRRFSAGCDASWLCSFHQK